MGNELAEGSSQRRIPCFARVRYTYTRSERSKRRHRRLRRRLRRLRGLHPPSPAFGRPGSSLFPLSGCLEVRECSGSARFSRSPWVGWSQHRPIRPLSSSIYLLVFPIHLANERGEPDLSPLNGINKLYYACTSPWNTIPAGVLVRRRPGEGFVPSRLTRALYTVPSETAFSCLLLVPPLRVRARDYAQKSRFPSLRQPINLSYTYLEVSCTGLLNGFCWAQLSALHRKF